MNFTKEQLEKAKNTKSAEELLALAEENGIKLTEEDATEYFAELNKEGEIADEELDNVSGGCGEDDPKSNPVVYGSWAPCEHYSKEVSSYGGNATDRCALCWYFHANSGDIGARDRAGECYYRD